VGLTASKADSTVLESLVLPSHTNAKARPKLVSSNNFSEAGVQKTSASYHTLSFVCIVLLLVSCSDSRVVSSGAKEVAKQKSDSKNMPAAIIEAKFSPPERVVSAPVASNKLVSGSTNFAEHIAPIIFENCSQCHRPGESAPFSFLNYRQVSRRAKQICEVTKSGYMPPWVPDRGVHELVGARELSHHQIQQLDRWFQDGCPPGPQEKTPKPPKPAPTWSIGAPDLVVKLERPFSIPAEGRDVFRTFVLPVNLDRDRFVRAVQVRPLNLRVSHHGMLKIDVTSSCRDEDAKSQTSGYSGMNMFNATPPAGYFLGWTPSKGPSVSLPGLSWLLRKGSDLVLQMHMVVSGKEELFDAEIGLYFTDEVPTKFAYCVELRNELVELPPGSKNITVEDSFRIPVAAKVLSIYPHAHYLGRDFRVFFIRPDQSKSWIFSTQDWDFNWQDDYKFKEPLIIPAGSRIVMQIDFDNSAENPRNPNIPPVHVSFGLQSTDEMATCPITLEVASREDLAALGIAVEKDHVEERPNSWAAYCNLGRSFAFSRDFDSAIATFRKGLEVQDHPELRKQLGNALAASGQVKLSTPHFEIAVRRLPRDANLRFSLALALSETGQKDRAREHLDQAMDLNPNLTKCYILLSRNLMTQGQGGEAIKILERGIHSRPDSFDLYFELIRIWIATKKPEEAIKVADRGIAWAQDHRNALLSQKLKSIKNQIKR
jgi:Flp pilus assembly protein TadD